MPVESQSGKECRGKGQSHNTKEEKAETLVIRVGKKRKPNEDVRERGRIRRLLDEHRWVRGRVGQQMKKTREFLREKGLESGRRKKKGNDPAR